MRKNSLRISGEQHCSPPPFHEQHKITVPSFAFKHNRRLVYIVLWMVAGTSLATCAIWLAAPGSVARLPLRVATSSLPTHIDAPSTQRENQFVHENHQAPRELAPNQSTYPHQKHESASISTEEQPSQQLGDMPQAADDSDVLDDYGIYDDATKSLLVAQQNLAQIRNQLDDDAVDLVATQRIRYFLESHLQNFFSSHSRRIVLLNVDCRTTLCELDFSAVTPNDVTKIENSLHSLPDPPQSIVTLPISSQINADDVARDTAIFIGRNDTNASL